MPTEALTTKGTVRGVFFSLGTTPSHDPRLDCAKAIIDLFAAAQQSAHVAIVIDGAQVAAAYERFVFQRILTTETLVKPGALGPA